MEDDEYESGDESDDGFGSEFGDFEGDDDDDDEEESDDGLFASMDEELELELEPGPELELEPGPELELEPGPELELELEPEPTLAKALSLRSEPALSLSLGSEPEPEPKPRPGPRPEPNLELKPGPVRWRITTLGYSGGGVTLDYAIGNGAWLRTTGRMLSGGGGTLSVPLVHLVGETSVLARRYADVMVSKHRAEEAGGVQLMDEIRGLSFTEVVGRALREGMTMEERRQEVGVWVGAVWGGEKGAWSVEVELKKPRDLPSWYSVEDVYVAGVDMRPGSGGEKVREALVSGVVGEDVVEKCAAVMVHGAEELLTDAALSGAGIGPVYMDACVRWVMLRSHIRAVCMTLSTVEMALLLAGVEGVPAETYVAQLMGLASTSRGVGALIWTTLLFWGVESVLGGESIFSSVARGPTNVYQGPVLVYDRKGEVWRNAYAGRAMPRPDLRTTTTVDDTTELDEAKKAWKSAQNALEEHDRIGDRTGRDEQLRGYMERAREGVLKAEAGYARAQQTLNKRMERMDDIKQQQPNEADLEEQSERVDQSMLDLTKAEEQLDKSKQKETRAAQLQRDAEGGDRGLLIREVQKSKATLDAVFAALEQVAAAAKATTTAVRAGLFNPPIEEYSSGDDVVLAELYTRLVVSESKIEAPGKRSFRVVSERAFKSDATLARYKGYAEMVRWEEVGLPRCFGRVLPGSEEAVAAALGVYAVLARWAGVKNAKRLLEGANISMEEWRGRYSPAIERLYGENTYGVVIPGAYGAPTAKEEYQKMVRGLGGEHNVAAGMQRRRYLILVNDAAKEGSLAESGDQVVDRETGEVWRAASNEYRALLDGGFWASYSGGVQSLYAHDGTRYDVRVGFVWRMGGDVYDMSEEDGEKEAAYVRGGRKEQRDESMVEKVRRGAWISTTDDAQKPVGLGVSVANTPDGLAGLAGLAVLAGDRVAGTEEWYMASEWLVALLADQSVAFMHKLRDGKMYLEPLMRGTGETKPKRLVCMLGLVVKRGAGHQVLWHGAKEERERILMMLSSEGDVRAKVTVLSNLELGVGTQGGVLDALVPLVGKEIHRWAMARGVAPKVTGVGVVKEWLARKKGGETVGQMVRWFSENCMVYLDTSNWVGKRAEYYRDMLFGGRLDVRDYFPQDEESRRVLLPELEVTNTTGSAMRDTYIDNWARVFVEYVLVYMAYGGDTSGAEVRKAKLRESEVAQRVLGESDFANFVGGAETQHNYFYWRESKEEYYKLTREEVEGGVVPGTEEPLSRQFVDFVKRVRESTKESSARRLHENLAQAEDAYSTVLLYLLQLDGTKIEEEKTDACTLCRGAFGRGTTKKERLSRSPLLRLEEGKKMAEYCSAKCGMEREFGEYVGELVGYVSMQSMVDLAKLQDAVAEDNDNDNDNDSDSDSDNDSDSDSDSEDVCAVHQCPGGGSVMKTVIPETGEEMCVCSAEHAADLMGGAEDDDL